jgi:hypothetical protein
MLESMSPILAFLTRSVIVKPTFFAGFANIAAYVTARRAYFARRVIPYSNVIARPT